MNNVLPSPSGPLPLSNSWLKVLQKKQLIVLFMLVVVRCICLYGIPDDVEAPVKVTRLALPAQIDSWKGKDIEVDPFVYEVLHPEAVLQKRYALQGAPLLKTKSGKLVPAAEIEVLAMYTRDTEGFHPPDVCMKSQGWVISDHIVRPITSNGVTLNLEVVTGEQREQTKQLAYCFTDPSGTVSGRTETFAKMVLNRFIRRRVGTVEVQFAYDARSLLPNGDFKPQVKALMVKAAADVYRQLSAHDSARASGKAAPATP